MQPDKCVTMCDLESFKIDLKDLKEDVTIREFDLDSHFFEALSDSELNAGNLHVSLSIRKAAGFYELLFHTEGMVIVPCDLCLDDMEQAIYTDNRLVAKLGKEYSEEEDIVIVDEEEGILDTSWFVYEFIVLAIPIKHVHAPGKCNHAMTEKLKELSVARSNDKEAEQTIDPRWAKLSNLKINN